VQVIHHRAPDGLQIPSYLTLPKATGRPVPLVVYVHGGPHARDEWGLDPMAQWLAAQGWAVLQPQFRGSTGFGRAYELAGQNQWGLAMQDDISSGVQHLIGQGLVDPERVCIFGASYGGYAAMWGLASTPQLYRCGISFAGISDLGEWLAEWRDVNLSDASMAWQNRMFGDRATARERLARVAAWRRAADVRAPLLLMHGYRDLRVPVSQSTRMRDALKAAGKTVQWEPFELAGHGFYRREDELRYFHLIQDFLRRHLDAPATAPAASQPSGR
jgi:dipeptidyl aminopeptidase/acylaminoacyl peptidase